MGECRKRTAECEDGAGLVGHRHDAGPHLVARHGIGLGDSAQRLRHRIGARQIGMRAVGAVAGDRDVDEPGIDLAQLLPAEAVLLGRTGAEILAEDVGPGDQLAKDRPPFHALEVERHTLHATIVGLEEATARARQHGHAARRVAPLRRLDLDHVGAEVGHQHPGHGARLRGGAGDDLDALKRAVRDGHRRDSSKRSPR